MSEREERARVAERERVLLASMSDSLRAKRDREPVRRQPDKDFVRMLRREIPSLVYVDRLTARVRFRCVPIWIVAASETRLNDL